MRGQEVANLWASPGKPATRRVSRSVSEPLRRLRFAADLKGLTAHGRERMTKIWSGSQRLQCYVTLTWFQETRK